MATIWQELFSIDTVGVHDDFFALGGHSLLALRMIARTENALGKTLSLGTLARASTIERIAATLRDRDHTTAAPCHDCALTLIQHGDGSTPMIGMPGAGSAEGTILGTGLQLAGLARAIGRRQPFFLATPGPIPPGTPASEVIPAVARQIVAEIHDCFPSGPVGFVGYSYGGFVAVETARQLLEAGREVAILALLDVKGPNYPRRCRPLERMRNHLREMRGLSVRQTAGYLAVKLRFWLKRRQTDDPATHAMRSLLEEVRDCYLGSIKNYSGRITLFRAGNAARAASFNCDDPTMGWSARWPWAASTFTTFQETTTQWLSRNACRTGRSFAILP